MSASLVGSEMCIRDRRSTAQHSATQRSTAQHNAAQRSTVHHSVKQRSTAPVSYTHLTLPTICSV
eukprot:9224533-Alexandrium_andersonii.AAC.1